MPISAAVVRDALVATMVTLLEMATKNCGSTYLDRLHDAPLNS
jgi:hypothetical protein